MSNEKAKILICGDRYWADKGAISKRLSQVDNAIIIHGACRGADNLGGIVAKELGFEVLEFPADWTKYGRSAGPIRNRQMLDEKPTLVLAFHNNISKSKGTADTVREAKRRKIPVEIISDI